jgi:O-antigen/teichoic acid export membrane protein
MTLPKVYTGPLFVGLAVSGWVLAGMNRWVVAGFHGEVQAGYFSLIGGAAMILPAMFGNALIQFVRPGLFRLGDEGRMTELQRRTDGWAGVYTVTGVAGAWVLAKIGPWLVGPLIAPAYADGLVWLGPAGSFGVALGLLPLFSTTLVAGQKESANGPAVLGASIALGVIVVSAGSQDLSHLRWALWLSPILPWLITRPLTMRALRNT